MLIYYIKLGVVTVITVCVLSQSPLGKHEVQLQLVADPGNITSHP